MSSESRSRILHMTSKIVGFSFREDELSPRLRKEIGDVAAKLDTYDGLAYDLKAAKEEEYKGTSGGVYGLLASIFGFIVIAFGVLSGWAAKVPAINVLGGVGVVFIVFIISLVAMMGGPSEDTRRKEEELASYWSDIEGRVGELAKNVHNELSAVYEAKVRPTVKHIVIDFASIIQAARGRGIILDAIECPHCGGAVAIPTSGEYFNCKYCGKTIHATKIFDKLKDILAPS